MHQKPEIFRKSNLRRFHFALQRQSVDVAALYRQLNIPWQAMTTPNGSLDMVQYISLLELAAQQTGRCFLAMERALDPNLSDVGVLKYLVSNASNLGEAIDVIHRFIVQVSPGTYAKILRENQHAILTYGHHSIPAEQCRQDVEGTLMQFVVMIRKLLVDESWEPDRIFFQHAAPQGGDFSNCPVNSELRYQHTVNGIMFSSSLLSREFINSDRQLFDLLLQQAQRELSDSEQGDSILDNVCAAITSKSVLGKVTAQNVAKSLNMSKRTLHRRLSDNKTSFQKIHNAMVLRDAKDQLLRTTINITELAINLGYSDSTGFIRAFRRNTGITPLQYRKQKVGDS